MYRVICVHVHAPPLVLPSHTFCDMNPLAEVCVRAKVTKGNGVANELNIVDISDGARTPTLTQARASVGALALVLVTSPPLL